MEKAWAWILNNQLLSPTEIVFINSSGNFGLTKLSTCILTADKCYVEIEGNYQGCHRDFKRVTLSFTGKALPPVCDVESFGHQFSIYSSQFCHGQSRQPPYDKLKP